VLHDVEDRREERGDRAGGQRTGVRRGQPLEELALAAGVDRPGALRALELLDGSHELEAPIEGVQELAVELRDLPPQACELRIDRTSLPDAGATLDP
jgi:hypothetical protein